MQSEKNASNSGVRAQRERYVAKLAEMRARDRERRLFCVNSVPKSGSTYVMQLLSDAVAARLDFGGELENEVEQDFSLGGLERALETPGPIVFKHHSLPNFLNARAFELLEIKFVNIVRNVFDVMVSVDEHLLRSVNARNVALWPGVRALRYAKLEANDRMDFIAIYIMPWYFKFMKGWNDYDAGSIFHYEDLVTDRDAYLLALGERLGVGNALLEQTVPLTHTVRFNVGEIGRGESLRERYQDRLKRYADFFPGFDYSRVGL